MYSYLQFDTFQKTSYSTLSENFFVVSRELHRHRELKQIKTLIGQVYWAVKFYKESSMEEDEACNRTVRHFWQQSQQESRSGMNFDSRVWKKAGRACTLTAEFGRKQVGHALLTAEFGGKQVSQVMRGLSAAICWWLLFAEGYRKQPPVNNILNRKLQFLALPLS